MSGGKIIIFQQSGALTSHFDNFWSIVNRECLDLNHCTYKFGVVTSIVEDDKGFVR